MTVGILLLAAGRGRRFGADKRFATLADGRTLLESTLDAAVASGLPICVCLRPQDDAARALVSSRNIPSLVCSRAEEGMGAVLAQGVSAAANWQGLLIALADMPWILPETYREVASAMPAQGICRPVYRGIPGHPVAFHRCFFPQLAKLSGDTGARALLSAQRAQLNELAVEDPGILRDVDLPEQLLEQGD